MIKIEWEKYVQDHQDEEIKLNNVVYAHVIKEQPDYHNLMDLKLFMGSDREGLKREYCQKIVDFVHSLEDENFHLYYAEYSNPKIFDEKYHSSWANSMVPTKTKEIL